MSISSVGGISPQAVPYQSNPAAKGSEELTTVTTQCNKQHEHTPSCPHTVSTRPAPQAGEPGSLLDTQA